MYKEFFFRIFFSTFARIFNTSVTLHESPCIMANGIFQCSALREIKIKVLRRVLDNRPRKRVRIARAILHRALIQSTIVSTAKPTRQKSSRGVNCGYTDFTSSLLVCSAAPTIHSSPPPPPPLGVFRPTPRAREVVFGAHTNGKDVRG